MPSSLVIQTSFLGDTVLTTPLLVQLANRGPVDVVTTPVAAALLRGHPAVREVIAYDKRGADAGLFGLLSLASRLRATLLREDEHIEAPDDPRHHHGDEQD